MIYLHVIRELSGAPESPLDSLRNIEPKERQWWKNRFAGEVFIFQRFLRPCEMCHGKNLFYPLRRIMPTMTALFQ